MKIFLDIVGCRLNQSEVESIANQFRALGHEVIENPSEADLAIVNTCAVTVKAAADSRKKLRRAARLGAKKVVATGCWATLYPQSALDLVGVSRVFDNQEKRHLVSKLLDVSPEMLQNLNLVREPLPGDRARTRAFVKVQEGCDHACTYCLTRIARGKSYSRTIAEIQKDIMTALAGDAKEVVLTGVQLGSWGRDLPGGKDLGDLMADLLFKNGIKRLRLSSIEPWDFNEEWLKLWQDARLCRHLHIPLQAGHDRLLQVMGRPITTEAYANLVEMLREKIPQVAITTDVIVGFPGETNQEFEVTKNFIRMMNFAGGHVFTFSPRPGTAAYNLKDRVPSPITKARNAELRNIFKETSYQYRQNFIGTTQSVLWETGEKEGHNSWRLSGLTDNYLRIFSNTDKNMWNEISRVEITDHYPQRNALKGIRI